MSLKRKALFWDIDEKDLDRVFIDSDDWVIVRVVEYGTLEDIYELIALYGRQKVKDVLSKEALRPMSAAMAFIFFGIDKDNKYAA